MNTHPTIVVHARLDPRVMDRFESWHAETHVPHVLAIPGVRRARRVRSRDEVPGTLQLEIELEDESAIQRVMGSPEAQAARQDWNDWAGHVHELRVEVFAPLRPSLPVYAMN